MVTTGAILFGDAKRTITLKNTQSSCNSVVQTTCHLYKNGWRLGVWRSQPGCPSDRVQNNKIGACLMETWSLNVFIACKKRWIFQKAPYRYWWHAVLWRNAALTVAATGCTHFVVHARIAKVCLRKKTAKYHLYAMKMFKARTPTSNYWN